MFILDLEDSVGDPFDDFTASAKAKVIARSNLKNIFRNSSLGFPLSRIAVRINSRFSPYIDDDIEVLNSLSDCDIPYLQIVQPKVNSVECLEWTREKLIPAWGQRLRLNPIIETICGVENLSQIAAFYAETDTLFHIGLIDLEFEQKRFPFTDAFSDDWMNIHKEFGLILDAFGFDMVYSANLNLRGFASDKTRDLVTTMVKSSSHMASLSHIQTLAYLGLTEHHAQNETSIPKETVDLAEFIVREYEDRAKVGKRLIVYDKFRLIPPHEYKMAKQYLAENIRSDS